MNNEKEKDLRNSRNKFELEGNVANISDIYVGQNNKKILRFDLAQNNNGITQYVPIVIKGELVNSYGNKIKKGDWITIKGRISTYTKILLTMIRHTKKKVLTYSDLKLLIEKIIRFILLMVKFMIKQIKNL